MKNHPFLFLYFVFAFLLLFIWPGKTESGSFPYTLNQTIHELPAAFTNQFFGITNETVRKKILYGFDELPFAKTGLVECAQSESIVTLVVPLESYFLPEITNQPIRNVTIRFQEPSGDFLPSTNYLSGTESLLAGRCREKLYIFSQWNTNAPKCHWMAPMENYGGLARMPFFSLPNGANESVPIGTNGWGTAFWVNLENPALLGWESILPPEEEQ